MHDVGPAIPVERFARRTKQEGLPRGGLVVLELATRLAVGVDAGVPGSCVSGRGQCWVAAFGLSGLLRLAKFFITISHCAWRRVISFSKAKKKRSKENALTALP